MAITYEMDNWLSQQGTYENHCFISWPHISKNPDIAECARAVRDSIEEGLATSFHDPKVYMDTQIAGGADWEMNIRRALCRSVSMVAICVPMYYRPEHLWCGLEWAAMEQLSLTRLPGKDFKTIIPLMVRLSDSLPKVVSRIQYIDVSRVMLQGRRYYNQREFRGKIHEIVTRIEQIAEELWRSKSRAECDLFQFPKESAFAEYVLPAQGFPLVS
jgi:hypothetical protein